MKKKWHKGKIRIPDQSSARPVPIVSDAAIARVILGEGRLIPLLILDTSERPDIEDLVKAQEQLPPGDVRSQWGRVSRSKRKLALILNFERPSNVFMLLEFDVVEQGVLIESILTARALYIQPGRYGERLSSTFDHARILIEVPELGFRQEWRNIWQKELTKYFRKRGLERGHAQEAAQTVMSEMHKISRFRMRRPRKKDITA
jgi:hypothetical protein